MQTSSLTPYQRTFVAFDKYGISQLPITRLQPDELIESVDPFLALDVGLKIRFPAICHFGVDVLSKAGFYGPRLFVDIKTHDIEPSSAEDLLTLIEEFRPGFVTCHLSGSRTMLRRLGEIQSASATQVVGVSILTDMEANDCINVYDASPDEQVPRLVTRGRQYGITHTVCSAQEAAKVHELHSSQVIFTPGIHFGDAANTAQARGDTVEAAIRNSADYLIIGTAITCSASPVDTTHRIAKQIAKAAA